ncbi:MAG TPA: hypothetical protein VG456_07555 [Candidatus Sulfopaludibacter sp.]|nr:hypothetical protein [Candidatus Sulfopaludibacter sp.]
MSEIRRRDLLLGALAAAPLAMSQTTGGASVALIADPADKVASSAPARWAADELQKSLIARGMSVSRYDSIRQAKPKDLCIVASGTGAPASPEAMALTPSRQSGHTVITAAGSDPRGLVYALLELSDRARYAADPAAALVPARAIGERPANPVRSIARMFVSDVEDKPWFNDREMWPAYLTMLASQRFNRFALSLSIGYDFLRDVTDSYFLFPYPFLLSLPGYDVRAVNLPDAERDSNLQMLKFISEQTVARGLEFQLGLWMHGYEYPNSPRANYTISGLNKENHGPYCRDALAALLKACPAIGGVTFRIHGESGVAEGSYNFWKTVFDGVKLSGRTVPIDLHSKGIDQNMIDVGLATGMPVTVSPKFWAEHMGMPYHQADIRDEEIPKGRTATGLMALSTGARSFTRYGYADLLRDDRKYGVIHRIWPGTQRLLLWGDPVMAAGYSRAFGFCGSKGVEIFEPLSFKGRRGSGLPGGRCAYSDSTLTPHWDWEKYLHSYRVWGRLLYDPTADPESYGRDYQQFGAGAAFAEASLSNASRILPVITSAHLPSAANNTYWPEMYTNQPIVDAKKTKGYTDTPSPKVFGNVSPLDPQIFARVNDFADELLKGERNGKYSPIDVAQCLEDLAEKAAQQLKQAENQAANIGSPEFQRMAIDVTIQIGLGRFFGAKLRAGVLYRIHEQTGDRAALEQAVQEYRGARATWARIAERAKGVYVNDVTVGELPWLRGHWQDRLAAIDDDLTDMTKRLDAAKSAESSERVRAAIIEAAERPHRGFAAVRHTPPTRFVPGQPVEVEFSVDRSAKLTGARLYYRHVNQAERWQSVDMESNGGRHKATVPGAYTDSAFPLQYYFELRDSPEKAWLYPGFTADLSNQPYLVVRRG